MDKQYANDINSLRTGESVNSTCVVSRKTLKKTKSGDDYCLICLQDKSGSVDGVIWPEALKKTQFEVGDFVKIEGEVEDNKYAEGAKKQLKITQIKKVEDKKRNSLRIWRMGRNSSQQYPTFSIEGMADSIY